MVNTVCMMGPVSFTARSSMYTTSNEHHARRAPISEAQRDLVLLHFFLRGRRRGCHIRTLSPWFDVGKRKVDAEKSGSEWVLKVLSASVNYREIGQCHKGEQRIRETPSIRVFYGVVPHTFFSLGWNNCGLQ